jgi:class 3 adenylate cyclase
LDYFGTTVNVASRLCALSTGSDIVVSRQVLDDGGVSALIGEAGPRMAVREDASALRGIDPAPFSFWRIGN